MAITFPYKNKGVQDSFNQAVTVFETSDTEYTKTGTAFAYAGTRQNILEFPSDTKEVWIRFDLFRRSSSFSAKLYHDKNGQDDGVRFYYANADVWANDANVANVSLTGSEYEGLHSYVLHLKAGDETNGLIELFIDGTEARYSANHAVAQFNGGVISGLYFYTEGATLDTPFAMFSDIVVSDKRLTVDDHSYSEGIDVKLSADSKRKVQKSMYATFSTNRAVEHGKTLNNLSFNVSRNVQKAVSETFHTKRHLKGTASVSESFDTKRSVVADVSFSADTERAVQKSVSEDFYTIRKIPFQYGKVEESVRSTFGRHLKSLTLTIRENTLSDKITAEVVSNMNPNDAMRGTFLDYPFDMMAESVTYKGVDASINGKYSLQRVTSMYKMDELLTTPRRLRYTKTSMVAKLNEYEWVTYPETSAESRNAANSEIKDQTLRYTGQVLAMSIAKSIGMIPAIYFDNFQSDTGYTVKSQVTYKSMLSNTFGWTTSLPWRQINIFVRGNVICFVERGKEPNVINLDNYITTVPQVTKSIYRTSYTITDSDASSVNVMQRHTFNVDWPDYDPYGDKDYEDDPDENPAGSQIPQVVYFSGTLTCGNTTLSYSNGLCVEKTVLAPYDMKTVTYHATMSYDSQRRMVHKREESENGITDTTVAYFDDSDSGSNTTSEKSLASDGRVLSETITVSVDLGNGFIGTSTYIDGEYQGSSISGTGVAQNNPYTPNEESKRLSPSKIKYRMPDGSTEDTSKTTGKNSVPKSLYSSDLPKSDKSLLELFANEIRSYNRSIQETISLSVISKVDNGMIADKHIIDFTDRILYRGNTYYLVSNTVTLNTSSFTQALTFTRWRK